MIDDLPFEGEDLFSITTDAVLQDMDKSIKASRILGVTTASKQQKHKQWRQWPRFSRTLLFLFHAKGAFYHLIQESGLSKILN